MPAAWNMDPACWLLVKDSGFPNQVPGETSPHLLLGAQDQRLGAEQEHLPCEPTGTISGNCQETDTQFGHVTHHDSFSNTILQGTLEGRRRRGRQRKCWTDGQPQRVACTWPLDRFDANGPCSAQSMKGLCQGVDVASLPMPEQLTMNALSPTQPPPEETGKESLLK